MVNDMRLIDADAIVGKDGLFSQRGCAGNCQHCGLWSQDGCRVILEAPTIDAVPVVRCKDCKYGEIDDLDFPFQYFCNYNGCVWNNANHFCSYGERKDGDGNG